MSFRYGTNGNDLNWDAVMSLYEYCLTCEEIRFGLREKIRAVLEEYFVLDLDDEIENFVDNLMCDYAICEGHERIYSPVEIDFSELVREGKTIDEVTPWYIWHDTNSNFVHLIGDVPDEYLTEEYIRERNEYLQANGLL